MRKKYSPIFIVMLLSASISLLASFVLAIDTIELAKNSETTLSCDINSILSCGTVAKSWQAEVFGFPNVFLGLIFEPIVITLAVLGLSGMIIPRWFALVEQFVYFLASVFAIWLFWQSIAFIGALCPWCLTITYVTPLIFLSLFQYNLLEGNFGERFEKISSFFVKKKMTLYAGVSWVFIVTIIIMLKYGPALLGS